MQGAPVAKRRPLTRRRLRIALLFSPHSSPFAQGVRIGKGLACTRPPGRERRIPGPAGSGETFGRQRQPSARTPRVRARDGDVSRACGRRVNARGPQTRAAPPRFSVCLRYCVNLSIMKRLGETDAPGQGSVFMPCKIPWDFNWSTRRTGEKTMRRLALRRPPERKWTRKRALTTVSFVISDSYTNHSITPTLTLTEKPGALSGRQRPRGPKGIDPLASAA